MSGMSDKEWAGRVAEKIHKKMKTTENIKLTTAGVCGLSLYYSKEDGR